MVLTAARRGQARRAARLALLITERGLGGADSDLSRKLDRLVADRSDRGRSALILADRLARQAGRGGEGAPLDDGALLALAFPERVAKSRDGAGGFLLANGRGAVLDPSEALAREAWITVGELGGGVARDRILLAARLDPTSLKGLGGALLRSDQTLVSGPSGLSAVQTLWFGRLALEERRGLTPDPALILATLVEDVRGRGVAALPWGDGSRSLRARVAFLRGFDASWPDLSDAALIERLEEWLTPRLAGQAALSSLKEAPLEAALSELIPWELRGRLDVLAPRRWRAPTGTSIAMDYDAVGGPRVDVRVQELFGLTSHPVVGPGAPLTLALLSPAGRPIQVTADLPGFWRGSWSDVRREMRGRYPKHPWPEDPAAATPTTRATRRV
jgi:ATP-dependent helicase HrpB